MRFWIVEVLLMVALIAVVPARGEEYVVTGATYSNDGELSAANTADEYEITRPIGKQIVYTINVTSSEPSCAMLFLVIGHSAHPGSLYIVPQSQETCARTYTNTYAGGNGNNTILISTDFVGNVSYSLDVRMGDVPPPPGGPGNGPDLVLGGALCGLVIAALLVLVVLLRRRKKSPEGPPPQPPTDPGLASPPLVPWSPPPSSGPPPQ